MVPLVNCVIIALGACVAKNVMLCSIHLPSQLHFDTLTLPNDSLSAGKVALLGYTTWAVPDEFPIV